MMKKMMSALRLYLHYVSVNVRSAMQYKTSLLLMVMGQLLMSTTTFFGIHFMFMRFSSVKGYTYGEVLLCFAIVLMQFSLAEMFARGFDTFAGIVRRGLFFPPLFAVPDENLHHAWTGGLSHNPCPLKPV